MINKNLSKLYLNFIIGVILISSFNCKKIEEPNDNIKDIEGNIYSAIHIGNQVWMRENLKTTTFNDGTLIPSWGYKWYNNDPMMYKSIYGTLYTFGLIDTLNGGRMDLCPTGWHIPSDDEWLVLTSYLGGDINAGGKLKELGSEHWTSPNTGATNETGFTALPGGSYYFDSFHDIGNEGRWWTGSGGSDNAWCRILSNYSNAVERGYSHKNNFYYIRCLKDN